MISVYLGRHGRIRFIEKGPNFRFGLLPPVEPSLPPTNTIKHIFPYENGPKMKMCVPVRRPPRSRICAPLPPRWASRFRCPICPKWPTLSACLDAPCTSSSNRAPPVRPADCQYPFSNWPRPSSVKSHFVKGARPTRPSRQIQMSFFSFFYRGVSVRAFA